MLNRRKHKRLSKEYNLEYGPFSDLFSENTLKSTRVKNVSAGGVLFAADEEMAPGTQIVISIQVTGWRHEDGTFVPVPDRASELRVKAIAEIVRVEYDSAQGYFRTGARFVGRVH